MRAYLFASPVAHTLSPVMHRAAFAYAGLSGDYLAEEVTPAALQDRLCHLHGDDLGANLSLPHKEAAFSLLSVLSPEAQAIGAVNTVVCTPRGLVGYNTDAIGLHRALNDIHANRRCVVILGAGGAARAALYALYSLGQPPIEVFVVNRSLERALALAMVWRGIQVSTLSAIPWERVTLVINTSSAQLHGAASPTIPWNKTPTEALLYDMVYSPPHTDLIRVAQVSGKKAVCGLSMLAYQAQEAFALWTGDRVPAKVFMQALEANCE